jgi:hypothetical protein
MCYGAKKNMDKETIIIDIDGVLMYDTGRWDDYNNREFIESNLDAIWQLKQHYRLIAYTSRKAEEGFWQTIRDFQRMKLDYIFECIYFDKPIGKFYIDDKAVNFESVEDIKFLIERIKNV